jgi:Spy/CpxP family protein refolding chaperone
MARHIGWALVALLAPGIVAMAAEPTAGADQPAAQAERTTGSKDSRRDNRDSQDRRPWWKNPRDMAEIGLTADQSTKIDKLFHTELGKMKLMRAEINELERGVDATMRANTTDIAAFARQVEQVEHKRAELNKARTVMLYRMRRVLNAEQNVKFQAFYDRETERKKLEAERRR